MLRHSLALCFVLALAYACSSDDESGSSASAIGGRAGAAGARAAGSVSSPQSGGTESHAGNAATGAGTTGTPAPTCVAYGQGCKVATDCCSGLCDLAAGACVSALNIRSSAGSACTTPLECDNLSCVNGSCASQHCTADGAACTSSAECCGQSCTAGMCAALNPSCKTSGNPCTQNQDCCGGFCKAGSCELGASYRIQFGDICVRAAECATGTCDMATGATVGVCGAPPSTGANCTGVEGTLCTDCGSCCSRLCAPYGPTGLSICQPASGCRIVGELCARSEDCCGGPGTDLPGANNVECDIPEGQIVGRCHNATGCAPQGAVCHYKKEDYTCNVSVSSARNACCGATGDPDACQLDTLGVPRCNGLGTTCRATGEQCASADDCCNHLPCVRAPDGLLRCYAPSSAGDPPCVPSRGSCTIDGDCCPGTVCIRPLGSTTGTCGTYTPPTLPTGTGGSAGAGGTANTGGSLGTAASPAGGSLSAGAAGRLGEGGATSTTTPSTTCHSYGQLCATNADCCNGVPCTNSLCKYVIL